MTPTALLASSRFRRTAALATLGAFLGAAPVAFAQEPAPAPRITVSGEGTAAAKPDLVTLSLGTMSEAPTASEALAANSKTMTDVIAAMKAGGIAERDIQSSGLQINPRYEYTSQPDGTQTGRLVAYQVTNTVALRVRDIAKTGDLIDKAVSLGANNGGSLVFGNDDPKPTVTDARKRAVADALDKARTLTEAAGVSLGRVLEINDTVAAPTPVPIMAKALAAPAPRDSVPVEAGENSYSVQVTMTFELK